MKNQITFTDYLSILYKWKKFLFINLLLILILATIISLNIPETFKSTASIILAPQNSMGLGGISSLMSDNSALSIGAKLFGVSSTNEDVIFGLLNSRTLFEKVTNKYNLYKYYDEEKERNLDKLIKKFKSDLLFEPNEYGMIEVNVINKDPMLSAEIANYFVKLADSMNIELGIRNAKNNRIFIEKRYVKNVEDLKFAEDSMYFFQKKYGIFAVPEQLEASVKAAAEIEGQLTQRELMLSVIKETSGMKSPQYNDLLTEINLLKNKVSELKNSDKLFSNSNILFPFKKVPDMLIKYFKLYREVEIQSKIMQFTLPMFEQAKVDEQKSMPTVLIIDKAVPAQMKYAPKKAFIIIIFSFVALFLMLPLVFRAESLLNRTPKNIIQKIELKYYSKIKNLYKI